MNDNAKKAEFWNNQLIELHTFDKEIYLTQITANVNNLLLIQRPVNSKNVFMPVSGDFPVTVYFHDDLRGLCTFESAICPYNNKLAVIQPADDAIKKAHRRHFFRVPVEVEVVLSPLSSENPAGEEEEKVFLTQDLSGGGLSYLSPYKMEAEELVTGSLRLETTSYQKKVAFTGKIVNTVKIKNKLYKLSLEFAELKESARSEIIKYCLSKQIELRNKLRNYSI